jgi:hypothetical protein
MIKVCAKCNVEKPLAEFCKNKLRKGGYHYYCKECQSQLNKRWRDANLEQALTIAKNYRDANKEACQKASKAWEKANPEKVKAWRARYNKENAGYLQDKCVKYRAGKKNRTPKWLTKFDWLAIKCKYEVAAMLNRESADRWDVDHIVPLNGKTVSGLHVPWNLQVIKSELNKRKANHF